MVKTFRSDDMMGALQTVMNELGPEAIILSARNVSAGPGWKVWSKPYCEVIAAPAGSPEALAFAKLNETGDPKTTAPQYLPIEETEDAMVTATISSAASSASGAVSVSAPEPFVRKQISNPEAPVQPPAPQAAPQLASQPRLSSFKPKDLTPRPAAQVQTATIEKEPEIKVIEPDIVFPGFHPDLVNIVPEEGRIQSKNLDAVERQLSLQGLDASLVQRLMNAARQSMPASVIEDSQKVGEFFRKQLESILPQPIREDQLFQQRIVALIGPSGSGKSSSCAKIAARCKLELKKKVSWLCLDTLHTGAIDEARAYANTLDVNLFVVYDQDDFRTALQNTAGSDVVLVDTPGFNPRNRSQILEVTGYLSLLPPRSTLLVAPATAKDRDLEQSYFVARSFGIAGMIATKLDETYTYGNLFNLAWRSKLPLMYVTDGMQMIENLHTASRSRLVGAILNDEVI